MSPVSAGSQALKHLYAQLNLMKKNLIKLGLSVWYKRNIAEAHSTLPQRNELSNVSFSVY